MKIVFLSLILSVNIFGQISFSEFPKIGYSDMFLLANRPMYYNNQPHSQTYNNYLADSFYYPQLRELGLTHIETFGGSYEYPGKPGNPGFSISDIPLDTNYNPTLKVLDAYFIMRLYRYDANHPMFLGGVYAGAQGNSDLNERYEVGGNKTNYENTGNFGFGTPVLTSVWITYPPNVGEGNILDAGRIVFRATTAANSAGYLLEAELPDYHQARIPRISPDISSDSIKYKLVLNARIEGYTNSSDTNTVAYVRITETPPPPIYSEDHPNFTTLDAAAAVTDITYPLRIKDFGGNSYVNLSSPYFYKNNGKEKKLKITIYWTDKEDLYIDQFYIYDNFYERMFISSDSTTTFNSIKAQLQNTFGSVVTNPLYSHFYNDEPWPNAYRSVNKISALSNQQFSQNKYVNGAVGDYAEHILQYGNSQGRLPYIMTDKYPFWYVVSTSSTSGDYTVQMALDSLIYAPRTNNSSSGLRVALNIAQNYTPAITTDDIPMICTIQVQAEKKLQNGIITNMRFRAPLPNEIKVQGFLSICYGAKGLAYYTINTQSPQSTDANEVLATYGLFDEDRNAYSDNGGNPVGLHQNPANPQKPNERFDAVKELNQKISLIENDLLQLTWQNAYSIHQRQPSGEYITNVQSYRSDSEDPWLADPSNSTFVESGLFKKTNELSNKNLEYFFIVNRRTLPGEVRKIKVDLNKNDSDYQNWGVKESGTSNGWTINPVGYFETIFEPGEGKLFKYEPVVLGGGTLLYKETIAGTQTLKDVMTIENGATLTVNGTYNCEADIIIKDGNIITVNGGTINFLNGSELILEDSIL